MKNNHFFVKVSLGLVCVALTLSSCKKDMEMAVSSEEVIIEAVQTETVTFGISSNAEWKIEVIQTEWWLTVNPLYGKGNATIVLEATENVEFAERIAFLAISGEGVKTDTVKVIQAPGLDVALKIEDENFRQYCLNEFDNSPNDGKISLKEALNVIEINAKGLEINTLAGIEYFSKIRKLNCSANNLKEIDVSSNKDLRVLDCSFNPITTIEVSELSRLTDLHLHSTNIKNIDVSKNAALELLATSNSPITALNVAENKELSVLLCSDNQLTNLDVSKNTKLLMLYCPNNRLTTLNLNMNTDLVNLWCNNQTDGNRKLLTELDISHNKALQTLSCARNGITNLSLSNNQGLIQLRCEENLLTDLDVAQNIKLDELKCSNNNLTGNIDISKNKLLKYIDFQQNPSLHTIYVWEGFDVNNTYYEKDKSAQYVEK